MSEELVLLCRQHLAWFFSYCNYCSVGSCLCVGQWDISILVCSFLFVQIIANGVEEFC